MRLRVLPLPAGGEPYALVLDDCDLAPTPALAERINTAARDLGAQGMLLFHEEIDLPEAHQQLAPETPSSQTTPDPAIETIDAGPVARQAAELVRQLLKLVGADWRAARELTVTSSHPDLIVAVEQVADPSAVQHGQPRPTETRRYRTWYQPATPVADIVFADELAGEARS